MLNIPSAFLIKCIHFHCRNFLQLVATILNKSVLWSGLATVFVFCKSFPAYAWVYPEHRQIVLIAIQGLGPEYRILLDQFWIEATKKYSSRLTDSVIDPGQGINPSRLDYASWAAISGDHSCSSAILLNTVLHSNWILKVADIAAQLRIDLANAKTRYQEINAIRNSDIKLQRADLEYATRAGANNVHFLLARPSVNTDLRQYLIVCLSPGSNLNALGAYAWFHQSALEKAARYAKGNLSIDEKAATMLAALADEAFALHFLEDVYAAGHIAGTWGDASLRKGTHDYYNEKGLEVSSWEGTKMIMKGDAFMRTEDAEIAALNVRLSLEQFLDAATGRLNVAIDDTAFATASLPDTFNICRNIVMPARKADVRIFLPVLIKTPEPGLATGTGELPRFRTEMGTFLGVSTSLNTSSISGGFGQNESQTGAVGGIECNIRFGFGLEGVLNESGDGLFFIQGGWRLDGSSTSQFKDPTTTSNSLTAAIPGRSAFGLRLRLPFYLVPGDLIFAGPFVYLFSPKSAAAMAIAAGNGGLIPWQSGIATPIGRFQFILGREIGVTFYGLKKISDALVIPVDNHQATLISYKSTQLNFPIVEYMPFRRSFSQVQSSSLLIQLTAGVDIPYGAEVIAPSNDPVPALKSVWQFGVRIVFDWRHYF